MKTTEVEKRLVQAHDAFCVDANGYTFGVLIKKLINEIQGKPDELEKLTTPKQSKKKQKGK